MSQQIHKIVIVKDETANADWNRHLLTPLTKNEKVIISANQNKVEKGYVRVKHGSSGSKVESIFSKTHFKTLSGKEFSRC